MGNAHSKSPLNAATANNPPSIQRTLSGLTSPAAALYPPFFPYRFSQSSHFPYAFPSPSLTCARSSCQPRAAGSCPGRRMRGVGPGGLGRCTGGGRREGRSGVDELEEGAAFWWAWEGRGCMVRVGGWAGGIPEPRGRGSDVVDCRGRSLSYLLFSWHPWGGRVVSCNISIFAYLPCVDCRRIGEVKM